MKRSAALAALLVSAISLAAQSQLTLPASPSTVVWGYYSAKAKPVLTIHSGDTVRIQTALDLRTDRAPGRPGSGSRGHSFL